MPRALKAILVLGICLLLVSCAHQPIPQDDADAGFLVGLFHGVFAPINLVLGLFTDVRIYEYPNTGWVYDLGWMIGISFWGGGGAAIASR
jgi:hypothetical protein